MIDIVICDDEKNIRERIVDLVEMQRVDCRIESFGTGNELLAAGKCFDVIFLDIQMEGKNGIETARAVREYDTDAVIVFVTAIKEYVFEAFDVGAFHYLLKPIEEKKFTEVFDNAVKAIQKRKRTQEVPMLFVKAKNRRLVLNRGRLFTLKASQTRLGYTPQKM